jgi:heavy metal translocating P-type ATPase
MTTNNHPYVFDEFFASGKEESISPFLTDSSKNLCKNLSLKTSLCAAALLLISFAVRTAFPVISELSLLIVYFIVGTPAFIDTIEDLKNFEINIDVLMTLAALLSVLIGSGFEGALLLVLFELSAAMENSVTQKTKGAITHLNKLSPTRVFIIKSEGDISERSVKDISVGQVILVKAGEIVPLDAKVIGGSSFVNLSHLTGESLPIEKKLGDEVQAGARNLDGTLTLEVLRTSSDSTLSRIMQLITHAQDAKPQLQRLIDRFGDRYAIIIMLLSLIFALGLPFIFHDLPFLGNEGSIYRALTFLIAASPCALVIATPTAYLSAISSCAKKGILLKGGIILDALSHCKTVAFDKTGTLTTGKLKCLNFESITAHMDVNAAISIAASLEQHVVHPIADALVNYAKEKKIPLVHIVNFKSIAGSGITANLELQGEKKHIYIGHYGFISAFFSNELQHQLQHFTPTPPAPGQVMTFILIGQELFCATFTDTVKNTSPDIIKKLSHDLKMEVAMLTGDHADNAHAVADQIGIKTVYADLRPEDKMNIVAELSQKKGLIMLGDGVNDAPALMRATVGISMGKIGSATAIDASDVVFLQDDISSLEWLIKKSHKTISIIKQNLFLALFVILFATTPSVLGFVPLWAAVILHEGGTVLVGLNSLRLLKK